MTNQIRNRKVANQTPAKDPSKWGALILGVVLLLSAVIMLVLGLTNTVINNTTTGDRDEETLKANNATAYEEKAKLIVANVESRIAPVGAVKLGAAAGKSAAPRSGKEVYTAVCSACHSASGLPTAPKVNQKDAWAARAAKAGFKGLLNSAINGTSAGMPARGGQDVIDEELISAIAYMTEEAGIKLDVPKAKSTTSKVETKAKVEAAPKAAEAKAEVKPVAEVKTAPEVKIEVAPKAIAEVKPVSTEVTNIEKVAVAAASTVAANVVVVTEATTVTKDKVVEEVAKVVPAANSEVGQKIYQQTCFACHGTGVLNAPRLSNVEEWKPRIATGKEALYHSAISGKNAMPPKGGNFSLSDDDIKAAVDYMVSESS